MILQALAEYYDRKSSDPNAGLATMGFEAKEIPFILEIDAEGKLIQIEDTREGDGRKKRARSFLVPQGIKKTSGVASNLLWDNAEYVLGLLNPSKFLSIPKSNPEKRRKQLQRFREQHQAFVMKINALSEKVDDSGLYAVSLFLDNIKANKKIMRKFPQWSDIVESNPNLTFRLNGNRELICQSPTVIAAIRDCDSSDVEKERCLISGDQDEVERLHTSIKGVWGAQSSGANIISFNLDAFNSFGKKQGNNAPVGKQAAFAYTTALNYLLRKDSTQRMQVGDASTVFWSEKQSDMETTVVSLFDQPPKDDPDRNVRAVQTLYKSIQNGRYCKDDGGTRFYVLGLAPNAARIAVRFWHVGTVAEMAERISQHFSDLEIIHGPNEAPFLSLFRLLVSTASLGKAENILPNLAGDVMRSIIDGRPYPQTLLAAAIRRIKAEQSKKDKNTNKLLPNVTYSRAALIKACINRSIRCSNSERKEELNVALDEQNNNIGYRLGRLFAVLEKVQEEANPGLNATIRDRYYGSASSSPVTAFSTLLKLSKHHIAKLHKGRAVNIERLIGEIMAEIQDFPAHLPVADQGRFAIGYYHQRQAFFTKSETKEMNHE